ncbi:MAG: DUF616 domain-containing protein [Patescibacteria group bacterium]|nr:DUF616 domain-containing protein [Patescibacteria group bacterium]
MQKQRRTDSSHEVAQAYTAITGGKDPDRNDITCFTSYSEFKRPVMNAKIYKILAHQYIKADISIWLDGNIFLLIPKEKLIKEFLGDADIAVFKHFERDCVYEEAEAAKGLGGDAFPYIEKHIEFYKSINYPKHAGLYECNMIIRRHSKQMEAFNNAWWSEICRHSSRDQLSFPYVLDKFDLKLNAYEGNIRSHEYFRYEPH